MHPPPNPQQQREEALRREQAKQEEQLKRDLEAQLIEFDAHSFYLQLSRWTDEEIPQPIPYTIHVSPLRQKTVHYQPLPLTRKDLSRMRKLSARIARLLQLLRAIDQRGIECPYIHQVNRPTLEKAVHKCDRIQEARREYSKGRGIWARFGQLINKAHLDWAVRDAENFKNRLEAVLMLCRHQEFAQDLMRLRQAVTTREEQMQGYGQKPAQQSPAKANRGFPNMPQGR